MARITYIPNRVIDSNGISDGATVDVFQSGTTTRITIYSDAGMTKPVTNPYVVPSGAEVPPLYYSYDGDIRVRVTSTDGEVVQDDDPYEALIGQGELDAALEGKVDRYPANPYSSITASYQSSIDDAKRNWWNGSNLVPTIGDGGALNGMPNPDTSAVPSMWQMWTLFNSLVYEPWKLAVDQGDTAAAAGFVAMATSQWAYIKTKYTLTQLKQGTGGVVNTSDDGRLHVMGLTQIHEMTGASDALLAAEENLWYTLTRFHDPLQTAINYGQTTPDGTACKSDPYGILYGAATDWSAIQGYGYVSSSNEFGFALAALYLYSQNVATKTSCLAYAQNLATFGHSSYLTPAPANANQTAKDLVYLGYNLDPNVAAANATASAGSISGTTFNAGGTVTGTFAVNQYLRGDGVTPGTKITGGSSPNWTVNISQTVSAQSINGTFALSGHGDSNQVYHQAQNAFYGKPLRGTSSVYLGGSCLYAALNAWLYQITGTPAYLTDARNVTNALASLQGFGRELAGVPYLIQARDPWSDGDNLPEVVRRCISLSGVDTDGRLKLAIANSAKAIMTGTVDGYLTPDWFPRERGTQGTDTWLDDGAAGYGGRFGGGQAKPQQMQTHGSGLALVVAAARVAPMITTLGSGVSQPISIETLAAEVAALRAALDGRMPRKGGTFVGRVYLRVLTFFADLNASGYPFLNWANNVIDQYNAGNGRREFYNGTTANPAFTIDANALGVRAFGPVRFSTNQSEDTYVFDNGTDVILNVGNGAYLAYRKSTQKWGIAANNQLNVVYNPNGSATMRGALTQNGTPTLS